MWASRVGKKREVSGVSYSSMSFACFPRLLHTTSKCLVLVGDLRVRFVLATALGDDPLSHVFSVSGGRIPQIMGYS